MVEEASDKKKVLLFDFWGTLAQQGVYSPVKQIKAIVKPNISFGEYIKRMQNALLTSNFDSMKDAFKEVFEEFGVDSSPKKLDDLVGLWNKNWLLASLFDESSEVLSELAKDYRIVLIANSDKASIDNVLEKFEIASLFEKVYLSCELGVIKSDPDFFVRVLEDLGVEKEDVVVIGDSMQSDILPAINFGIKAVLVDRKGRREYSPKVVSLRSLSVALEDM